MSPQSGPYNGLSKRLAVVNTLRTAILAANARSFDSIKLSPEKGKGKRGGAGNEMNNGVMEEEILYHWI